MKLRYHERFSKSSLSIPSCSNSSSFKQAQQLCNQQRASPKALPRSTDRLRRFVSRDNIINEKLTLDNITNNNYEPKFERRGKQQRHSLDGSTRFKSYEHIHLKGIPNYKKKGAKPEGEDNVSFQEMKTSKFYSSKCSGSGGRSKEEYSGLGTNDLDSGYDAYDGISSNSSLTSESPTSQLTADCGSTDSSLSCSFQTENRRNALNILTPFQSISQSNISFNSNLSKSSKSSSSNNNNNNITASTFQNQILISKNLSNHEAANSRIPVLIKRSARPHKMLSPSN